MDTSSIESFWSESVRAASWCGHSREFLSLQEPTPSLDLDALKVALTRLDHSPQKGKAFIGRSGALRNRRPPSRGSRSSRQSSTDSLHFLQDQQAFEDQDPVTPRVVNIEVQLEGDNKASKEKEFIKTDTAVLKEKQFTFREHLHEPKNYKHKSFDKRKVIDNFNANQEIRRKLFDKRLRKTIVGSNPLLNSSSFEAEESFARIKEEVTHLAAKIKSSSDISDVSASDIVSSNLCQQEQRAEALRKWNEERESLLESASAIFEKDGESNRSSSEADFVISDRESIADSGLVNRRTVIKINEKKSKSATSLTPEETPPLWVRDLQTRRSLRTEKEKTPSRIIPIEIEPEFEGGINVSIVNQSETPRRDSTSRMYVRLSDSENRPSRASAFNVRRTIEKRQIQQERRERKALREKIREQLRSLSEGRERRDSSGSHVSSSTLSQNSIRSKSMSSLDQDQEDFRSESPLFKVQSSPTLEKEKDEIRSYLFGTSNLTEGGSSSHDISPSYREEYFDVKKEKLDIERKKESNTFSQSLGNSRQNTGISDFGNKKEKSFNRSLDSFQSQNINQDSLHTENASDSLENQSLRNQSKQQTENIYSSESHDNRIKSPVSFILEKPDTGGEGNKDYRPIPPPRRHRLSLSAGHITLEGEEKPNWIRLAKERRSLRTAKQVDQLSDRASTTASKEPDWVAKARKKLEKLNVTLTSTTDFNSVSSRITESSSAWSRGGLDALDDLREESTRIGVELAEEASARVNEELGIAKDSSKMLEHNKERSRDPSAERPRVSFEPSAIESSDGDSNRRLRSRKPQKDEVRFGDLKHDWGGVQTSPTKTSTGKTKEMRFGEIITKETLSETPQEKSKEMWFGDHVKTSPSQRSQSNPSSPNGSLPVMRFGDTPLNLFPATQPKGVQSSSKFESVAGPDPTKMTAEQLNQNVEEYDFPIPTGKEDVSEFMRFLEEGIKKAEIVPEVVSSEDHQKPKPKSILKRRSVENVLLELDEEGKSEFHQKVEHRKSASFDWDSVGKGGNASLDTGYTRNNEFKSTTEHGIQHLESSNKIKQSVKQNISTNSSIATNSSFFNVKLRHVSPNKREPALTNESHTYHTEHNTHRKSQGASINLARGSDDFSSLDEFNNGTNNKNNQESVTSGTNRLSAATLSYEESMPDTAVNSKTEVIDSNHMNPIQEYKQTVKKISKKEIFLENQQTNSYVSSYTHNMSNNKVKVNKKKNEELPTKKGATMGSNTVRELLQKVQDSPSPAWGTCRTGRGINATEPKDAVTEQPSYPATSSLATSNVDELQDDKSSCSENTPSLDEHSRFVLEEGTHEICIIGGTEESTKPSFQADLSINHSEEIISNVCRDDSAFESENPGVPVEKEPIAGSTQNKERELEIKKLLKVLGYKRDSTENIPTAETDNVTVPNEIHCDSDTALTPNSTTQLTSNTKSHQSNSLMINSAVQDGQAPSSTTPPKPNDPSTNTPQNKTGNGYPMQTETKVNIESQEELPGKKRPAKVFSFTFNPNQTIVPETTFVELEEDSLIQQKVKKETENKRKTEETKTLIMSTNLNNENLFDDERNSVQLDSHKSIQQLPIKSKFQSSMKTDVQKGITSSFAMKSPEVPARSWKKLVAQNLSSSSGERRKSSEILLESSQKPNFKKIQVEVIDDEEMNIDARKSDDERRRSSLLEWEAIQRQRLEEEERNRLNKNLSIKPVSTKIKELVKMHGSFMSMFSKDKKTDIKGTVDGKDDIVFRKMSSDNLSRDSNSQSLNDNTLPMKSPYIVKKLLTPQIFQESQDHIFSKSSQLDIPKSQSSSQRTPRAPRRTTSKSRLLKDRSVSPAKPSLMRDRSQSPTKLRSVRNRSPSPSKLRITKERTPSPARPLTRRERSPSPARPRSMKERTSSPARHRTLRDRTPSPARIRTTRDRSPSPARRYIKGRSPSPSARYIHTTRERTPSPARLYSREQSHSPVKSIMESSSSQAKSRYLRRRSISPEKGQLQRDKVKEKDLKISETLEKKGEIISEHLISSPKLISNLSKSSFKATNYSTMQNSLNDTKNSSDLKLESQNKIPSDFGEKNAPPLPPKPANIKDKMSNHPSSRRKLFGDEIEETKDDEHTVIEKGIDDSFSHDMRKDEGRSSIKDPKNRKEWLNKMLNTLSSDTALQGSKDPSSDSLLHLHKVENRISSEYSYRKHDTEKVDKGEIPLSVPKSSSNDILNRDSIPLKTLSNSGNSVPTIARSKDILHFKSLMPSSNSATCHNSENFSKIEQSPLSTPLSLRSSVREALLSDCPQNYSSKRGPVSLSSILGDSSSRSSSLASTPLTSPRATPERVIRKESIDLTSKLDIIPESVPKSSSRVHSTVEEHKENIAPIKECNPRQNAKAQDSSSSFSYQSPFRLKAQDMDGKKEYAYATKDTTSQKVNDRLVNDTKPKPFTFGKPSVTMKNMVSGVDLQRVSTSTNKTFAASNMSKYTNEQQQTLNTFGDSYNSNSYPRENKDSIGARFSEERISLKEKVNPKVKRSYPKTDFSKIGEETYENFKFAREQSQRRRTLSDRSTPDREGAPVSLADILSRKDSTTSSIAEEPLESQFKPNLSFSKELNDISHKYRKDISTKKTQLETLSKQSMTSNNINDRYSCETKVRYSRDSSLEPNSKESSPIREIGGKNSSRITLGKEIPTGRKQSKEIRPCSSCPPRSHSKTSSSLSKQRTKVVRRNSSLKRNRNEDMKSGITPKRERKDSESSADLKSETVVQNDGGWTKTKTTVRRARLGSFDKTKQIVRTNSGKTRKEKTFKADASKALEYWAAGTNVDGKLMKKEGQRFSHETEEEVNKGQRTCRSVARRVIRRGSRRLSGGGELLTETKETSTEGTPKGDQKTEPSEQTSTSQSEALAIDDGLSRKMKTSTDGERYMTQSVSNKDGKHTFTTEGVNNKTTNSIEVIGGDDFEAKREVQGKTGHRVLVERSKDNLGRPSTVVKKVTSQSRVVITKTKKKTPVVV